MKKSKFSEEQIAYALGEVEAGRPPPTSVGSWAQRGDVLHLEEEVRASGRCRAPAAAVA